jgi:hypothetical protein
MYLYNHIANMLFVNYTPYKSLFNQPFYAIFLESFDNAHGDDHYLLGTIPLWNLFMSLNMVFLHLYNTIPWVGINVLNTMILDNIKCYL